MVTRRAFTRSVVTSAISLGLLSPSVLASQSSTPEAGAGDFGNLLIQDLPELPTASTGEVEVVLSGHADTRAAGVLIHNASDDVVAIDEVSGIARGADGSLFAVSSDSNIAPTVLEPGEYGMATVRFDKDLVPDVTIDYTVKTEEPGSGWIDVIDLPVVEISIDDERVIGIVENTTDVVASSFVAVVGVFFDADAQVCGWFRTYLNDDIQPGGIGTFSSSRVDGVTSSSWAMAASGWAGS